MACFLLAWLALKGQLSDEDEKHDGLTSTTFRQLGMESIRDDSVSIDIQRKTYVDLGASTLPDVGCEGATHQPRA